MVNPRVSSNWRIIAGRASCLWHWHAQGARACVLHSVTALARPAQSRPSPAGRVCVGPACTCAHQPAPGVRLLEVGFSPLRLAQQHGDGCGAGRVAAQDAVLHVKCGEGLAPDLVLHLRKPDEPAAAGARTAQALVLAAPAAAAAATAQCCIPIPNSITLRCCHWHPMGVHEGWRVPSALCGLSAGRAGHAG